MDIEEDRLVKDINRVLYEAEADSYDLRHPEVTKGDKGWWKDFGLQFIDGKVVKVLDVGGGTGFVLSVVLHYGRDGSSFICYDISLNMLRCARAKLGDNSFLQYICGDGDFLPFQEGTFDIITANALFHHLPSCKGIVKEMDRVLKKGGIIAVSHEPNRLFFNSLIARVAASIYKLIGCGMGLNNELQIEVNRRLRASGVVDKDLTKEEILRLVEFQSPFEQGGIFIDRKKGFSPEAFIRDNFLDYKVLKLEEYTTFYHRPTLEGNPLLMRIIKGIGSLFFLKRGNLFSFIIKKG